MRLPLVRIVVQGIMVAVAIVALLLGAMFALGCLLGDPGYLYRPADAGGRPIDRWFQTLEGVSLEGGFYDTLIGESSAGYAVKLIDATNREVTVLGGELSTKGLTLKAHVPQACDGPSLPDQPGRLNSIATMETVAMRRRC